MGQTALHATWTDAPWPQDVVPIPLGSDFRPIDPAHLGRFPRSGTHFFFVAPGASAVRPDAVALARPALAARPDVGVFYADDAVLGRDGAVTGVHCKPSFNPALMLADDYIGFPLLIRADVLGKVGLSSGWRHRDAGWYRFCLDAVAAGIGIDRIPHTLLASFGSRPKARRRTRALAVSRWFDETGQPCGVRAGRADGTLEVRRRFDPHPEVTLVVPTRQSAPASPSGAGRPFIAAFLDSLGRSTYPQDRIKVLVGDDREDDAIYRGRRDRFALTRVVTTPAPGEPFNYAAKMNRLWRAADTDLMILMNDDIAVAAPGWIEALLTYAVDPGVGGVGARLLFPDGRIQHAGMFGGIFGVCAHPWYLGDAGAPTYAGWAETQRDCSAVTGAVFATRRGPMEAVDGFDEGFSLDFNDVDLCFRMRMLGYRIVYTPYAEMVHHEKASRQARVAPGDQVARYLRRWRDVLSDDPMFSPQLRDDTDVVAPREDAAAWTRNLVGRSGR